MEKIVKMMPKFKLSKLVYLLCGVIIVVFAASNLFMLNSSGGVADAVRLKAERELVRNEISRQTEIAARDQSQISHSDESVSALTETVNTDYVQTEIANWLWNDFGLQLSIVVDPNGKPKVTVLQDKVLPAGDGKVFVEENRDLIGEAVKKYLTQRVGKGQGFVVSKHPIRSDNPIYSSTIRFIDGELGVVVAQAIIPHDKLTLPNGRPHVLLTFKPFSADSFSRIGAKLGLARFEIMPEILAAGKGFATLPIRASTGNSPFVAVWRGFPPSGAIRQKAMPMLLIFLFLVGSALIIVALFHRKALKHIQENEAKNAFLVFHDALTGLPNRLQFDHALDEISSEGAQDRCAILCVDLDRLKLVNETHGRDAGDSVLQTVSSRIHSTVGENGLTARTGGDEFVILLREQLDQLEVLELCDTLITTISEEIKIEDGTANVGASIGVAWWPDDSQTAKGVIRSATEALYRAKENGQGRTYLANDPEELDEDDKQPESRPTNAQIAA